MKFAIFTLLILGYLAITMAAPVEEENSNAELARDKRQIFIGLGGGGFGRRGFGGYGGYGRGFGGRGFGGYGGYGGYGGFGGYGGYGGYGYGK